MDGFAVRLERMVLEQIAARGVADERVLAALRDVPRQIFVPEDLLDEACGDYPLPIGHGQTISQPYIVAAMTELLQPKPDHVLLEVGAGSGYQAAVLARLVRHVYSIEIVEPLARAAAERLSRLGCHNVTVRTGDGHEGWPEHAPFDGIVVTCAAASPPPPLLAQLRPGGRLVIPLGPALGIQELVVLEKTTAGKVRRSRIMSVRFVPLTGPHAGKA